MSPLPANRTPLKRGILLVELDGAGGHPAAWRTARATPSSVLAPAPLRAAVLAAESAGFHAATFSDAGLPGHPGPDTAAQLNALQRAAFAGPITRSIALIPEVDTVYTEPFHISTQLASLDYVSGGRTGWLVAASPRSADAAAVGRETARGEQLSREAANAIEVSRRLWDSWEDGAVIRDVATGRYLDVDKLHYVDFEGGTYSVKGPSIIPRPLQGQLPVLAPAGLLAPEDLAAGAADALLVSALTPDLLAAELADTRKAFTAFGVARTPALIAELDVVLDSRGQSGADRIAALDVHTPWKSPRARFVGTATGLIELLTTLLSPTVAGGPAPAEGIRLHPAVLEADLQELSRVVLPELRRRGLLAPTTPDATFRELLGLARPASRYSVTPAHAGTSAAPAYAAAKI